MRKRTPICLRIICSHIEHDVLSGNVSYEEVNKSFTHIFFLCFITIYESVIVFPIALNTYIVCGLMWNFVLVQFQICIDPCIREMFKVKLYIVKSV